MNPTTDRRIRKIIFACDVGIGSSAMGAARFRSRIRALRPDMTVLHMRVDFAPADTDILVCQQNLRERAGKAAPLAQLVTVRSFLSDPALDKLYHQLTDSGKPADFSQTAPESLPLPEGQLIPAGIRLRQHASTKEEAIRQAGELLHLLGYTDSSYLSSMLEREAAATTYMGGGIAIPHGASRTRDTVRKSGVVILQYPDGVPFGEEKAYLVFGLAGTDGEHLSILANLSRILEEEETTEKLIHASTPEDIIKGLSGH